MSRNEKTVQLERIEAAQVRKAESADMLTRLDRLEGCFLTALQELRAARLELTKNAGASPTLEKLLDAKEVADLLGENERWVYQQAKKKSIPSIRLGKYWKFSPSALQKWLEQKTS